MSSDAPVKTFLDGLRGLLDTLLDGMVNERFDSDLAAEEIAAGVRSMVTEFLGTDSHWLPLVNETMGPKLKGALAMALPILIHARARKRDGGRR